MGERRETSQGGTGLTIRTRARSWGLESQKWLFGQGEWAAKHLLTNGLLTAPSTFTQNRWWYRMFEARPALKLYISRGAAHKDLVSSIWSQVYPPVAQAGLPSTLLASSAPLVALHRQDVHPRLCVTGTSTDHFGHPLLLAGADVEWDHPRTWLYRRDDEKSHPWLAKDPVGPLHATGMSISGILNLAGSLLVHFPLPLKLSLTGFLEHALCVVPAGSQVSRLVRLERVSFGPLPARWPCCHARRPQDPLHVGSDDVLACLAVAAALSQPRCLHFRLLSRLLAGLGMPGVQRSRNKRASRAHYRRSPQRSASHSQMSR